ncbi:hypothetical protein ABZT06_47225 [Streptomyces sp. NPDC005483]|uniref:hypothetical protein n=1 Tax=Streptomyces sp. NPDC005483 TaxID=3154882 RepID=UPI0033BDC2B0
MAYYEPWPALKWETWRPHIRAAVLSTVRVAMHRKLMKTAAVADLYPVPIGTDAIVSPSIGPKLQRIAAEGLAEMYFRNNDTRAHGLGVEVADVEHIQIEL